MVTLSEMIVEAEDGDDFQEYCWVSNGKKIKRVTPIGIEVKNPRTKEIELHLFNDIKFKTD